MDQRRPRCVLGVRDRIFAVMAWRFCASDCSQRLCFSSPAEDFTGGDGSMLNLSSAEAKEAIANGQLWERLRAAFGAAEASAGTNLKDKAARVLMGCGSQSGKDTDQNDMGASANAP